MGSHKSVNIYAVKVTGVPAHSSAVHLGISANAVAVRLMSKLLQIAEQLTSRDRRNADFEPPFSTLTIGVMQGGSAVNILAGEASFVFDLRAVPEHDPTSILAPFRDEIGAVLRDYPAVTISFEPQARVPPLAHVVGGEAEALVRQIGGDNSDIIAAPSAEGGRRDHGAAARKAFCSTEERVTIRDPLKGGCSSHGIFRENGAAGED